MFVHIKEVWPTWTFCAGRWRNPQNSYAKHSEDVAVSVLGGWVGWGALLICMFWGMWWKILDSSIGFPSFSEEGSLLWRVASFNSYPNYPDDMNRRNLPIICYHCFCSFQNWSSQIVQTSFMPWTARWILTLSCGRKTPSMGKWNWEAAPAWLFPGPTERAAGATETAKLPFEGGSAQHPRGGLEGPLQRLPIWRWTCQYSALESTKLTLVINRHTFS